MNGGAPLPTPAAVMAFLDEKAVEIDQLGKLIEEAHLALGDREAEWEAALDEALLELVEEYEARGERLPGEDVRLAKARKRTGFEVYAEYRRAKRRVEALEKHARKMETAISARQSTLKGLQEEAKVPTFDPRTGEVFGSRQ